MVSREDAHRATGNSEHGGTGMAKIDESKLGDDFSYIFRIAESDIDGLSPISIGLTSVKGIGLRTSQQICSCLLYTSPSPRDKRQSRMPSSA